MTTPGLRVAVEWTADLRCCVARALDASQRCVFTLRFDNHAPMLDVCARLRMEEAARAAVIALLAPDG